MSDLRRDAPHAQQAPAPPPADRARWPGAGLLQDVRYAIRVLRHEPTYAAMTLAILALGIGATTTLFSVANSVLLTPLPWPEADRLVRIEETRGGRPGRIPWTISNATYHAWSDAPSTVEAIGGFSARDIEMTLAGDGDPERIPVASVTAALLTGVFRARPALGRLFVDEDPGGGAETGVALLSHRLWQQRLGGREDAIGRVLRIDGRPHTIVGIMPADFVFPSQRTQLWTHWGRVLPVKGQNGVLHGQILGTLARLRPGVTPEQAGAEATARARNAPDMLGAGLALFGGTGEIVVSARSPLDIETHEVRPAILILLAAIGLLLLTALGSLVNIQLARATGRRREMAIRAAVGAGAGRLTRQWLVESGLTSLAGGTIGLLLAVVMRRALPSILPADFPRVDEIALDWRVLLFAAGLSGGVSLVCGVIPALHGWRLNLVQSLAEDGTAPTGGSLRTPVARARALIMAGQIALASVLLVGAGLLARSFVGLIEADRGLDPRNLLTAHLPFPRAYPDAQTTQVLEALSERLRRAPGVRAVSYGGEGPFLSRTIQSATGPIELEARLHFVSPDYLSTIDARLVAGRWLSAVDTAGSEPAVVVNRSFATRYLGPNPVGERVPLNVYDYPEWRVVGVVEDLENGGMGIPPLVDADEGAAEPEIFVPHRQAPDFTIREAWIMVRTDGDPVPVASTLRDGLRERDATLAFGSIMTLEERVMTSLARPRAYALLLGGFAFFALLIAGVGLFGVLSYTTALRTPEFGVRTALGATPRDVGMLVVRQALAITVGGVLAGLAAAAVLVRSLASLVHGVSPHDMTTFAAVPLVLAAVAAAACAIPARRAARLDPRQALRAR